MFKAFCTFIATGAVFFLYSCSNSTSVNGGGKPNPPPSQTEWHCVGHASHWSDGGGITDTFSATGIWDHAADGSTANLRVLVTYSFDSTELLPDSVFLIHGATGWKYDPSDSRASWPFDPTVVETGDSVIVTMGAGDVVDSYFLRKQ